MTVVEIIAAAIIGLGALIMLVGAVGVVRFPDVYTRLHAAGKGDTLGQSLVFGGLMLVAATDSELRDVPLLFKLLLTIVLVLFLNPTATHALARSAWIIGLKPWTGGGDPRQADDVQRDQEEEAWKT